MCTRSTTDRYPLPLCHEHVLYVWSTVDADVRDSLTRGELLEQHAVAEQQTRTARERRIRSSHGNGEIYYLQVGDSIKIGHTGNLNRRMPGYPPGAKLLARHPGTVADEQALHRQFRAYCTAGREWYSPAPEIRKHIAAVQAEYGTPRADLYERKDPHRSRPTPRPKSAR